MFCGCRHLNVDHGYRFKQAKVCINGVEGFWNFAKERLIPRLFQTKRYLKKFFLGD
jgi:hypothetical protein